MKCGFSFEYHLQRMTLCMRNNYLCLDDRVALGLPRGPSQEIIDDVTTCKNLTIFGTLSADSNRIGDSTLNILLITHNVIYMHPNVMLMQALLHICNIRSELSKTRFVAPRVNLLAARSIKAYLVPYWG